MITSTSTKFIYIIRDRNDGLNFGCVKRPSCPICLHGKAKL